MERLRSDVGSVRPNNRSKLLVELDLREVPRVGKRLEHTLPLLAGEVEFTGRAIVELEAQAMPPNHCTSRTWTIFSMRLMLGKRRTASSESLTPFWRRSNQMKTLNTDLGRGRHGPASSSTTPMRISCGLSGRRRKR
jgi:hypothetical protein